MMIHKSKNLRLDLSTLKFLDKLWMSRSPKNISTSIRPDYTLLTSFYKKTLRTNNFCSLPFALVC